MNPRDIARRAAQQAGINPTLFLRQMQQEAGFRDVTSPAGAQGYAQFMPATARSIGLRNPHDPNQAYPAAAKLMANYLHQYGGSWSKALVAYNAGPGAVSSGKLPAETQNYLKTILGGANATQPMSGGGSTTSRLTEQVGGQDNSGARKQLILNYLMGDPSLFPSPTGQNAFDPLSLVKGLKGLKDVPSMSRTVTVTEPTAGGISMGAGKIARFEGKPVAAWMVPALQYARHHGWGGSITSGVRTRAEQARLYANRGRNPYPVARPGTSNHEIENGGAVDVTDAAGLARLMRGYRGRKLVQGTAINDPVHFSRNGR